MASNSGSRPMLQALLSRDPNQSMNMSHQSTSTNYTQPYSAQARGSQSNAFHQTNLLPIGQHALSTTYPQIPRPFFASQSTSNAGLSSFTKGRYYGPNQNNTNGQDGNNSNTSRTYVPIKSRTPPPPPISLPTNNTDDKSSTTGKMISKKRKNESDDKSSVKKQKLDKETRPKRPAKPKVTKVKVKKVETSKAVSSLSISLDLSNTTSQEFFNDDNMMMRVMECAPPSFLAKARLTNRRLKELVDGKTSIFSNCRIENFGYDMPAPPQGLSERQYSNLLGGKGCLSPGCQDKLSSRTYWSWAKRWCLTCWKQKIEREDRVFKSRANKLTRTVIEKMLECLPYGMHDSFMKPHDIMETVEPRGRSPRLYKYYMIEDVDNFIVEYEALTPAPYVEDPAHTPEQKAAAAADHQTLMDGLEDKRNDFFAEKKAKNNSHMDQVKKIEAGVRSKRDKDSKPNNANRQARKDLFTRRASEEIGHITTKFVESTKAFKAATRIFRDGGTERGWQTLKPKIVAEWEKSQADGTIDGVDKSSASSPAISDNQDVEMSDSSDDEDEEEPVNLPATNHGLPTNSGLLSQSHLLQSQTMLNNAHGSGSNDAYGMAQQSVHNSNGFGSTNYNMNPSGTDQQLDANGFLPDPSNYGSMDSMDPMPSGQQVMSIASILVVPARDPYLYNR